MRVIATRSPGAQLRHRLATSSLRLHYRTMHAPQRLSPRCWRILASLVLLASVARVAHAQIEAGQVIDDSLHVPLTHVAVSLQRLNTGNWQLVDSTTTDERGLFQFRPTEPGVFRVGVLGTSTPEFAGRADTLAADSLNERMLLVPWLRQLETRAYLIFEVETPAEQLPGETRTPTYPKELIARRVDGEVDAQFVVTASGAVDMSSFKVLLPTEPAFADAVRRFLVSARYKPATIGGHPVRQVVQQKFMFNMNF